MTEYSKILRGSFTSTGVNKALYLPMVPDTFEWWNETTYGTTPLTYVTSGIAFQEDGGIALLTQYNATAQLITKKSSANIVKFFSRGTYSFGPVQAMSTTFVTKANPANVTVTAHGYNTGDTVWIYGTTGMLQIAGAPYVITKVDANNFTIPVNSTGFASAATAGYVKQFFLPYLYIPELCYITNVTQASQAVITTNINHNFVVGQEVGFAIPSQWGMTQLDSNNYLQTSFLPQQAYVTAVTANTLTVNINSTGFTAFSYPTSAVAAAGVTFPQVYAIGDQNTGYTSAPPPPFLGVNNGVIGIPGAFVANTRQGVVLSAADSTTSVIQSNADVIKWRAIFPDAVLLNQ